MQGQTYYAETVHEDRLYWINVMYFAKANKSVLVGGIAPFTIATKIEKLCGGGGGGSTSATCPSGFVAVGSFCIEPTMGPVNKTWYEAAGACADKGAQLCSWSEWAVACKKGILTDVQFGTTNGKYEWIDDYTGDAYQGIADPRVYGDCEYLSRAAPKTPNATTAYRCCSPKQ